MKIGFAVPHYEFSFPDEADAASLARSALHWAQRAEEYGFDSVWVSDHFWLEFGQPKPQRYAAAECWSLLSAIAATTNRVRLGSLVSPAGFRNPHLLAHTAETVNQLASGRLEVGLGAGWNGPEFTEHGLSFSRAGARLAHLTDTIGVIRQRSAGRTPARIWVGGHRPGLLRLAARHADVWNTGWDMTAERYTALRTALDQSCREAGRDPATLGRSLGLTVLIGRDDDDVEAQWRALQRWSPAGGLADRHLREWSTGRLVGTFRDIRGQLRAWEELGVEEAILAIGAPFAVFAEDQVDLLADTVLRRLS